MRRNIFIWLVPLCFCLAIHGQEQATAQTNRPTRQITLEHAIRLALEQNLSIQIARFDPRIIQYDLSATYGDYDPTFAAEATRSFSETEGGRFGALPIPPEKAKTDAIVTSLNGLLPWGMTYDIGTDFQHRYGSSGRILAGPPPVTVIEPDESFDTDVGISLTQPLLRDFWADATRRDIKILKRNIKISEFTLRQRVMEVLRDVQVGYYELTAARDEVRVREMALGLADRLLAENKRKVEVGTLAPLDERQAEAEVAEARANLMLARREVLFRENVLRNLITDNYKELHPVELIPSETLVAVPTTPTRRDSWMKALENRPDFLIVQLELEKQGIEIKFRQNQIFPVLDLVGSVGRRGRDDFDQTTGRKPSFSDTLDDIDNGRSPRWSIGAVFSVPLSSRRERYALRGARETSRRVEAEIKALHQTILAQVENAITLVESTFEQIEARKQTRLFREAALDAEQKKLENGKSTSFQVLELQNDLTGARSAEIRALAEYNKSLAELYFSEGTILEKNRVKIE